MSADCNELRVTIEELLVYAQGSKNAFERIQRPDDKDHVIANLCESMMMMHQLHEAKTKELVSSFHSAHESYLRLNAL
jgi:hypothetical protein